MKSKKKGGFSFVVGGQTFIFFIFSLSLFALTKGIGAQHPHTSVQHSGEDAAAAFSAAALRAGVARGGGGGYHRWSAFYL